MLEMMSSFWHQSVLTYLHNFLFGIYPYVAMGVFLIGSLIRFDRDQYTWRSGSSQMLRSRQLWWGSNLFHFGILFLFFGHLFGLLTPHVIYSIVIDAPAKQRMAIWTGGIAGAICFVGLTLLLHRRLFDPRILRTSAKVDVFILVMLWVQLLLGLLTLPSSWQHEDGAAMLQLAAWAQAIVTFQSGAADLIHGLDFSYYAHLVMGMTLFLLTPFSRLVHIFSAPVWYLFRRWQIVRVRSVGGTANGPVAPPYGAPRAGAAE